MLVDVRLFVLVHPDRPDVVRADGRDASEHVVGAGRLARVRARHDLPGLAVVVHDERAVRAEPLRTDRPDVGRRDRRDRAQVAAGRLGHRDHAPLAPVEVLDQRARVRGADRPDIIRSRRRHVAEVAASRNADDRPRLAVPVLDERRLRSRIADRPDVRARDRLDAVERRPLAPRDLRARDDAPRAAVPVLGKGVDPVAVAADRPDVVRAGGGDVVQRVPGPLDVAVLAVRDRRRDRNRRPARPVPVQRERVVARKRRLDADRPDVALGERGHPPDDVAPAARIRALGDRPAARGGRQAPRREARDGERQCEHEPDRRETKALHVPDLPRLPMREATGPAGDRFAATCRRARRPRAAPIAMCGRGTRSTSRRCPRSS